MTPTELKRRTKLFALEVIKLVGQLPKGKTSDIIGRQLIRSGTSVGANYRAACRARSSAEFISKMSIVEEEADESMYWMELLVESGHISKISSDPVYREAHELLSITVSSINTARKGRRT